MESWLIAFANLDSMDTYWTKLDLFVFFHWNYLKYVVENTQITRLVILLLMLHHFTYCLCSYFICCSHVVAILNFGGHIEFSGLGYRSKIKDKISI